MQTTPTTDTIAAAAADRASLRVPTDSALDMILAAGEPVAAAFAAELFSIAEQADANAKRYTRLVADHGELGSASHCARVFATSLRWRAQQILDAAASRASELSSSTGTRPPLSPVGA